LRHELIPHLEDFAPGFSKRLWQTADILMEDHAVLDSMIERAWEACLSQTGAGYRAFNYHGLVTQPVGMQRCLLRRAASKLRPGLRDIDYAAIKRAIEFLADPPPGRKIDWIAGLHLMYEADQIWLANWEADLPTIQWPQAQQDESLELSVPGKLSLEAGWELHAEIVPPPQTYEPIYNNPDPYQAWFDQESLQTPLTVRTRLPGDRMQLQGMETGKVKLSDLMINLKLPRRAREGWPVVCSGEQIGWLPGLRQAAPFQITAETKALVYLRLYRAHFP
jgi:tRNA(Ile)-lysidine synthase